MRLSFTPLHRFRVFVPIEKLYVKASGISEDDFTALFVPVVALAAAGVTAAAALPSIRFAQVPPVLSFLCMEHTHTLAVLRLG